MSMVIKLPATGSLPFTTTLKGKGRRCRGCGKLIHAGEPVTMSYRMIEKWYPVKGIVTFKRWLFRHIDC